VDSQKGILPGKCKVDRNIIFSFIRAEVYEEYSIICPNNNNQFRLVSQLRYVPKKLRNGRSNSRVKAVTGTEVISWGLGNLWEWMLLIRVFLFNWEWAAGAVITILLGSVLCILYKCSPVFGGHRAMPRIIALLFLAGGLQAAKLENSLVWPMANGNDGIWPCGGGGTPDTLIASHLAGGGDQQFNGMDNGTGDYVGNGSGTDGTDNGMDEGAGSVRANGGRKWKVDEISWQMISQLILLPPIPFPSRDNFLWPFWVLSRAAYELGMDQLTNRVKQSSDDLDKMARFIHMEDTALIIPGNCCKHRAMCASCASQPTRVRLHLFSAGVSGVPDLPNWVIRFVGGKKVAI
jgi:hypothetical protein